MRERETRKGRVAGARSLALLGSLLLVCCVTLTAQNPFRDPADAVEARYAKSQPVVSYVLRIAPHDTTGYDVEMRIRNARDTFRLAMATHPEYDDRYWRFVTGLRVQSPGGNAVIARLDSSLWRVTASGGNVTVRYRLSLPAQTNPNRNAWRPFLTSTGGMLGGPQSFMYVVGEELAPSHVRLDFPAGWDVATGLAPTSDPHVFFAPTADVLIDSPILRASCATGDSMSTGCHTGLRTGHSQTLRCSIPRPSSTASNARPGRPSHCSDVRPTATTRS